MVWIREIIFMVLGFHFSNKINCVPLPNIVAKPWRKFSYLSEIKYKIYLVCKYYWSLCTANVWLIMWSLIKTCQINADEIFHHIAHICTQHNPFISFTLPWNSHQFEEVKCFLSFLGYHFWHISVEAGKQCISSVSLVFQSIDTH